MGDINPFASGPTIRNSRNSAEMPNKSRDRSRSSHRQNRGSRFNQLADDVNEHEMINNDNDTSINSRYIPKNKKPPPITVFDISIMSLRNKLSLIKDIDQEKLLIRLTQHGTKIFVKNNVEFNIMKEFCIKNKISCYTHTTYEERRIKICLYGLFKMDCELLKNELMNKYKVKPLDIKIIQKKTQNKRYDDECIYLLYFQKKDNMKIENLRRITGLFNIKVNWKYYSARSHGPTQCSICQDFGHGTENCLMKPKCIRCAGTHHSKDCPHLPAAPIDDQGNEIGKPKIPEEKVKCANCGDNHTANYKKCQYREQFINVQSKFKPSKKSIVKPFELRQNQFPPLLSHRQTPTVAPPVHSPHIPHQQQPRGLLSHVECSQIMTELLSKLPHCHTIEQQIQLMTEIAFKYTYGSP